ncbi:hypothetical protein OPIT5_04090 [Opitutaceae bacterium TAV5]|nr:hypothetical protein OPIT5_04090 [Opitutaceae bacterium TAV5]
MNASDFAKQLRKEVLRTDPKGKGTIQSRSLIKYLDNTIAQEAATASNDALPKQTSVELHLAHYNAQVQANLLDREQMFASILEYGKRSINAGMIINAGAAVAILSFIGSLTANPHLSGAQFAESLLLFTGGVLVSALACGLSYCTQYWYYHYEKGRLGPVFHWATIVCVIGAYALFIVGAYASYLILKHAP